MTWVWIGRGSSQSPASRGRVAGGFGGLGLHILGIKEHVGAYFSVSLAPPRPDAAWAKIGAQAREKGGLMPASTQRISPTPTSSATVRMVLATVSVHTRHMSNRHSSVCGFQLGAKTPGPAAQPPFRRVFFSSEQVSVRVPIELLE